MIFFSSWSWVMHGRIQWISQHCQPHRSHHTSTLPCFHPPTFSTRKWTHFTLVRLHQLVAPECGSSVGNIYWQTSAASQSLVGGSFPRPATLMISSSTLELDGELFFTAGLKDSEDKDLCLVLLWWGNCDIEVSMWWLCPVTLQERCQRGRC